MAKLESNNLWQDQSERAQNVLDFVLHQGAPDEVNKHSREIEVEEAKRAGYVLDYDTGRSKSRVLFITTDESALEKNSAVTNYYRGLAPLFDELHLIVALPRRHGERAERLESNLWRYTIGAISWWDRVLAVRQLAKAHLKFNGIVRPDIIVATDAGVSALAAYTLSSHFERAYQVHINDARMAEYFAENRWSARAMAGWFALRRADAIRVASDRALALIKKKVGKRVDLAILPTFHNYSQFRDSSPAFTLKDKYPEYSLFILTEASLAADSPLQDVISALRSVLLNPRVVLVVIGTGKARRLYEEKARLLGIERNIIFLGHQTDLISLYKTADVFIEAGTGPESEERVLKATMAGLPLIAYETNLRTDLFKDNESALLCEAGDVHCLMQKFNLFLNRTAIRVQLTEGAKRVAHERLIENPEGYYRAMRDTIEVTLLKSIEQTKEGTTSGDETEIPVSQNSEHVMSEKILTSA